MKHKKNNKHSESSESESESSSSSSSSSSPEPEVKKHKKTQKKHKQSRDSTSPQKKHTRTSSESSNDEDDTRKVHKHKKRATNDDDKPQPRKRHHHRKDSDGDEKLKKPRRDLETSKWDSPAIKDKSNERREKSPERDRKRHHEDIDRNRSREKEHRFPNRPDRREHEYRDRDNRHDRRNDDRRGGGDYRKRDEDDDRAPRRRSRSRERNGRRTRFSDGYQRRRSPKRDYAWGKAEQNEEKKPVVKEKPNFGLSGKLTEEVNTYKGIVVKYTEPLEARKPKRRWRLYPFKGEKVMQTLYIHRESGYLLGRERKVVDIPLDHPSCSKQHAALQYRLVPFERPDGSTGKRIRPYIIDLESANGTYVNNVKIEPRKYVELFEKDVLKFGYSTREYVLLHENSKDEAQDDDVQADEVVDEKPKVKIQKLEPMEPIIPQEAMIG